MEVSINQLMELTGKTFRTIKKKLEPLTPVRQDNRSIFYDSKKALPLILSLDGASETIDKQIQAESLRMERAKREKLEIQIGHLRGEMIPIEDVVKTVEHQYSIVRARVRSLPSKLAKTLSLLVDPHDIHTRISEAVDEALIELTADEQYGQQLTTLESARAASDSEPEENPSPEPET